MPSHRATGSSEGDRAASTTATELERELQKIVVQGGEMFMRGQDSVKKELSLSFIDGQVFEEN